MSFHHLHLCGIVILDEITTYVHSERCAFAYLNAIGGKMRVIK